MTKPSTSRIVCAVCSTHGAGQFCSNCGAAFEAFACAGCNASLSPGARFCQNCGKTVGASAVQPIVPAQRSSISASLPWVVPAIALVTLLAFLAGNAFNSRRGSTLDAPQNALPQAGLDDRGAGGGEESVRGIDILQLSPQERADRLFDRMMLLNSQGKSDSVLFFLPIAISAYQMLSQMNADQRYDLGRIAEVGGALPLARAQADTILQQNPTHLLGLILGARVASLDNRTADRKALETRILAAYPTESAKKLPEYERHENDVRNALADARRSSQTAK